MSGLTDAGFEAETAAGLLEDVGAGLKARPNFENARTDPNSKFANALAPVLEKLAQGWEAIQALYHSLSRDTASGISLDKRGADLGKSRFLQARSETSLILYNRSSASPVSVLTGAQAKQSATGTLWETVADATIPALGVLLSGLDLNNITWQSGTTVRITFTGSPTLTPVAAGDTITITGATAVHNGTWTITAVNPAYIDVTIPARTSGTGNETGSAGTGVINDVETSISVPAQCIEYGPFEAAANTIDAINTPVSGWDAVGNSEAQVGRLTETDAEFRRRLALSTVIAQGGTTTAITDRLIEVDGVTYAQVEENDTGATVNGIPAHSIRATIVGGLDQDVVNALGKAKGAGIGTTGTSSGTYIDPRGLAKTIYYNRVTKIAPYLLVEITHGPAFPIGTVADQLATEAAIRAALDAVSFDHGEDLINHRLNAAVSGADLADVLGIVVKQSLTVGPTLTTNIAIATTEQVDIDPARISFAYTLVP